MTLTAEIDQFIDLSMKKKLLRSLPSIPKEVIDFSSNDYLGLSNHPMLIKKSIEFTEKYGVGATGSRLISGNLECFTKVENQLQEFKEEESATLFNSGFQANISIIPTLLNQKSLIIMDRLCHNSLIQGASLSKAKLIRFNHNDLKQLENLLKKYHRIFEKIMIIAESLYGMDGDFCDIEALCHLAKKYDAIFYLDEAHAMGVYGKNGEGLSNPKNKADITLGTFGKGIGSFGAFIGCSKKIKQYLINRCPGIIYTTALPPPVLGAISGAIELLPSMKKERLDLISNATKFRTELQSLGFDTYHSASHIIPIIIPETCDLLSLHRNLLNEGFHVFAVRPPTVPHNKGRLRIALSTKHTKKDRENLIKTLKTRLK